MKKNLLRNSVIIVLIILAALSYYSYHQAQKRIEVLSNPELNSEYVLKERDRVRDRVAKLMLLPEGVDPDLAIVQDVEMLRKEQPFFRNAEDGDQVLIYPDRAIIYRESDDVIINISPVSTDPVDEVADDLVDETDEDLSVIVEIRNGSGIAGAAGALRDELGGSYEILSVGDADRSSYDTTLIVNMNGLDVTALAADLGADVVDTLPEGEERSSADIVIILGRE